MSSIKDLEDHFCLNHLPVYPLAFLAWTAQYYCFKIKYFQCLWAFLVKTLCFLSCEGQMTKQHFRCSNCLVCRRSLCCNSPFRFVAKRYCVEWTQAAATASLGRAHEYLSIAKLHFSCWEPRMQEVEDWAKIHYYYNSMLIAGSLPALASHYFAKTQMFQVGSSNQYLTRSSNSSNLLYYHGCSLGGCPLMVLEVDFLKPIPWLLCNSHRYQD